MSFFGYLKIEFYYDCKRSVISRDDCFIIIMSFCVIEIAVICTQNIHHQPIATI